MYSGVRQSLSVEIWTNLVVNRKSVEADIFFVFLTYESTLSLLFWFQTWLCLHIDLRRTVKSWNIITNSFLYLRSATCPYQLAWYHHHHALPRDPLPITTVPVYHHQSGVIALAGKDVYKSVCLFELCLREELGHYLSGTANIRVFEPTPITLDSTQPS